MSWRDEARCDGRLAPFFAEEQSLARSICWQCPVRTQCRDYAIEQRLFDRGTGIWGGMDPGERERYAQRRRKGGVR